MASTVYLYGDDARELERNGYCESCLRPAREWAEPDCFGNYEVKADLDREGNLVGFLCQKCWKPTVCLREYDGDGWVCVYDENTYCIWNNGHGMCLHEHPSSPSPLEEEE